jgi:hypothetical protein
MLLQLDDEDEVYDLVDEEHYAKIVEDRRNKNDFVVDDSKYLNALRSYSYCSFWWKLRDHNSKCD